MSSRRRLLMAKTRIELGEFFFAAEIIEIKNVEAMCDGGCAFSALINNYSMASDEVCGIYNIDGGQQLWLQRRYPGNLEIETINGSESFNSGTVEDGKPHHIVVNANVNAIEVYVDGNLIDTRSGRYFYGNGTIYEVGAYFNVKNFRVWNRFLTGKEIQAVYNADRR